MPRCFVAVDINDRVRQKLRAAQEAMRPFGEALRFPDPAGIHVTLKFLGSVEEGIVPRVQESLRGCASGGAFEFHIRRLGAFPRLETPRVVWAGIEPQDALTRLYLQVEKALAWQGPVEAREFHPHITLARVHHRQGRRGRSGALESLVEYIRVHGGGFEAGPVCAAQFELYESVLLPAGARYRKLASFSLQ